MVILPDDHTGYLPAKDEKSGRVDGWKRATMKLLRWIAPPILLLLAYVTIIVISGIVILQFGGDTTGYGGTVIFIVIALLLWPVFPCLYSATLLRDCKHRICYTLYCSCFMGYGICIVSFLLGNNPGMEWLKICTGLFLWSEIGALLGLLKYKIAKE